MNRPNEETYGIGNSLWLFAFDVFLSIESIAILLFHSDPFNLVPTGATPPEAVIFGIGLAIWTEILALKYNAFGILGQWVRNKRD
jgi:hypothetical protein